MLNIALVANTTTTSAGINCALSINKVVQILTFLNSVCTCQAFGCAWPSPLGESSMASHRA